MPKAGMRRIKNLAFYKLLDLAFYKIFFSKAEMRDLTDYFAKYGRI